MYLLRSAIQSVTANSTPETTKVRWIPTFQASCSTFTVLDSLSQANPVLGTLSDLLNRPETEDVCPKTSQAPGIGGG